MTECSHWDHCDCDACIAECNEAVRLMFGRDADKPMDKVERRRESWRRSSRKYRAVKAREKAQAVLFDDEKPREESG